MTEILMIQIAVAILFLPLLGFVVTVLLGGKIKWVYNFENIIMFVGLAAAVVLAFFKLTSFGDNTISAEFVWINLGNTPLMGDIQITLGILLDNVSVLMMVIVMLISFLVHIFSIEYMRGDPRYNRYFAYLGLFTFSMAGIVLTHNILMMYIFWELVGLSSYLLIGFWFEKKSASDAAKKAFIVNRIGDIGMFIGIMMLYNAYHTFTFDDIFYQISIGNLPFDSEMWLTITGLLIFAGAIGKSAQVPLHVWLPDAMEGPTPVSALIHAATMVAAGVYLTVRVFGIFTADAMLVIALIGALSAFIPATIALTQNDIKKVLAYSTVSQLGYMIMALGVGAYTFAFFHLITHAFFKACLFLGSGSVIHGMHHEQDIQNMGGLRKKMPLTYYTFLISSIAISGIPLTSGFLSKDGILAGSFAYANLTGHWLFPIVGFFVAMLTAFYMFRLIILTFHGEPKNKEKYEHAHESKFVMTMPLIILAALSFFFWYTPNPVDPNEGWVLSEWIKAPELYTPESTRYEFMIPDEEYITHSGTSTEIMYSGMYEEAVHAVHYPAMILSLLMAGLGILFAFLFYQWKKINADKLAEKFKILYNWSLKKWHFEELYDSTVVKGTIAISRFFGKFDQIIIDGAVNGVASITRGFSFFIGKFDNIVVDGLVNFMAYLSGFIGLIFRRFQTGRVQTYLMFVLVSVVILLFLFKSF
jgi:NADH-quinone oxidoreductase subunit L